MIPKLIIGQAIIYAGNNLDILPELQSNSVDSIVCDPPYELGFMGKSWDNSGIAYSVELWQQCLRVLKPGGHLLAFGGTRTWHRLAVAIEDAGFEIRDNIAWLYGSGFPKSLNISKAIDKLNGKHEIDLSTFGNYVKELREKKGWSRKELDDLMGTNTAVSWWEGRASGVQLPSKEAYNRLKEIIEMDNRFDYLIDWAEAQREIIGTTTKARSTAGDSALPTLSGKTVYKTWDETIPATDEAKAWDGWGTALKPAHEPIVVARKPVIGTVAENVLQYGTGALNIDASRIGTTGGKTIHTQANGDSRKEWAGNTVTGEITDNGGRWPANIILDEYTAELLDEQSGILTSGALKPYIQKHNGVSTASFTGNVEGSIRNVTNKANSGGASRFFYVAKASKRDRNEGLDELPTKTAAELTGRQENSKGLSGSIEHGNSMNPYANGGSVLPRQNFHPTVKPTALMQYLIRLVTPDNGTVLDPFCGSGSTGKAAILEGKRFIGIELTAEYLPIIEGRLKHAYLTLDDKEDDLFD
jgi:DNA modification methylase